MTTPLRATGHGGGFDVFYVGVHRACVGRLRESLGLFLAMRGWTVCGEVGVACG